MMPISQTWSYT
ncbi:hypothetical protein F383_26082 [Gossypium arboreum]|uniref:Uncharacterized protein n=1 Tax=Gossypium arboreum TaxID=29729 RepID=A0A0B0P313_GOSAR|nr:hypothetical protein F383_26082 [Gossypium arboreum]